jgi:hypothetical protein
MPWTAQRANPGFEEEVIMFGSELVSLGTKPTESDLPKIAAAAALLAAVPAALGTLVQDGGLRTYLPILALIVLVTLGVFAWGVPSALDLDEPGPSVVGLALSVLGVVTLVLFFTGLPVVLAAGGIVLGRTQLDVPEDRRLALAAIRVGAAAIVLYLLVSVVDLL